jgi:Kdo2-lipid IVA lauroyltransferase/acyltransferase
MSYLLKFASILTLSTIHRLGAYLGYVIYYGSGRTRRRMQCNLRQSGLAKDEAQFKAILKKTIQSLGQGAIETLAIWQKDEAILQSYIQAVIGWELVEKALAKGKGLIFLTPHLGCFEIASIFYGAKHPITVLYRPPKLKLLQPLIEKGRERTGVMLAEANASGVRKLMQALKRGEAIGILPDQVPNEGEGEWAPFFGAPAYTMSLASKIAEKSGATVLMAFSERLAHGEGYKIHISEVASIATPTLLNQAIEQQIAQKPEQYLWSYNRFKKRQYALAKPGAPQQ